MHLICDLNEFNTRQTSSASMQNESLIMGNYLIINTAKDLLVYENKCPHRLKPLNTNVNQILDDKKNFIRCEHHQALFTISDGLCISGPCTGSSLKKIPFRVYKGKIYTL